MEGVKPTPESGSASRRAYIRCKYQAREFIAPQSPPPGGCQDNRQQRLVWALRTADLRGLLQVRLLLLATQFSRHAHTPNFKPFF